LAHDSLLSDLLLNLPDRHRAALAWFEENAGATVPWPRPLSDGTLLVAKAKGIYKPNWSKYALSVRHSLNSPYPDGPVLKQPDGLWTLDYHTEGFDPFEAKSLFTNEGLINCWKDVVPVGVIDQVKEKPNPRYRVLGLALVADMSDTHFRFQGVLQTIVRDGGSNRSVTKTPQDRANGIAEHFDPRIIEDERARVITSIHRRQGGGLFRRQLLDAYEHKCPITNYDATEALEAAHIIPYRGPVTNHPTNGLLLRADVHSLFDLGLIAIDARASDDLLVVVDRELRGTRYEDLSGCRLSIPRDPDLRPSIDALRIHRERAGI